MKLASVALRALASAAVFALVVGCAGKDDKVPSGHIVMFGSREVLLVPAAGGEPEWLRIDDKELWDAAFSEDGRWVAFNPSPFVDEGGFRVRNLESGRTRLVPGQPPQDDFLRYDLAWAPDGRSVAFVNGDGVYVIGVDGTGLAKLGRGTSPTWTPDGRNIVFASGDNTGEDLDIAVVRPDGTGLRLLGEGLYPDVSPSGDEVAYSTSTGVFVKPLAGGETRLVVPNGFGPVWAPDGRYLAFIRYTKCGEACSGRIFVVPADGGRPRAVGPTMGDPGPPDDWMREDQVPRKLIRSG